MKKKNQSFIFQSTVERRKRHDAPSEKTISRYFSVRLWHNFLKRRA
jgi:hypothetical protein